MSIDQPSTEAVSRVVLMTAQLPAPRPVDHVEVRRITIAPGVAAGPHVHNGPVVGHILEGSVIYQRGDEDPALLTAGDVFYEPEDAPITRFDAQADGVTFVGYFLLAPGEQPTLTMLD